jgi:hypothetical protein
MSTKIWAAWRFSPTHLNEFLDHIRTNMWAAYMEHVRNHLIFVKPELVEEARRRHAEMTKTWGHNYRVVRHPLLDEVQYRWELLEKRYIFSSTHYRRTFYGMDAGVNVWLHGRYIYVIPWGKSYDKGISDLEWCKDYHYQNQSDRPENITAAQWQSRSRTWNRVCLGDESGTDWNDRRLCYTVVSFLPTATQTAWHTENQLGFYSPATWETPENQGYFEKHLGEYARSTRKGE